MARGFKRGTLFLCSSRAEKMQALNVGGPKKISLIPLNELLMGYENFFKGMYVVSFWQCETIPNLNPKHQTRFGFVKNPQRSLAFINCQMSDLPLTQCLIYLCIVHYVQRKGFCFHNSTQYKHINLFKVFSNFFDNFSALL